MRASNAEIKFLVALAILGLAAFVGPMLLAGARVSDESTVLKEQSISPFENIELIAKAAYVYDSRTHTVLFAKDEDKRLPLASLTKVMSALVASELGIPETEVVVTGEALKETGDNGLLRDERWSLKDLLDFALISSSNDGMKAVALSLGAITRSDASPAERELDFVRRMNEVADSLNMKNTYFTNVTGLDETDAKGGAYGTARDMAILFDHVLRYKPELFEATREKDITLTSRDSKVHIVKNTGYIVTDIPGIKASKTGYTDIAGGNLVVAFDPEVGRPVIIAVLGSTIDGRFEDVLKLMRASIEQLKDTK